MRTDGKKIILVNALSVTNQSGLHVLAGHLDSLAEEFTVAVIARSSMTSFKERFAERVDWVDAPEQTARWLPRAMWEFQCLQKISQQIGASVYFTPSGIATSRLSIPQVVFCQNPWCLVPTARRKKDAVKAWLQRRAYRQTMKTAEVMVFNSEYMRQAYRQNAGFDEKRSLIVYQAADEETRERSKVWENRPRTAGQIVCVSAMAPHKNIETLLRALEKLKCRKVEMQKDGGLEFQSFSVSAFQPFSLHLVGPWPDSNYERKILRLITELGLSDQVQVHGFVSREELDQLYAESQVFCLMSRCESFGIPAIEAQLFGTPVVCSNVCAVPEICGEGGVFCDPDDVEGIATNLRVLLESSNAWKKFSEQALKNANRFQWSECSRPLVEFFAEGGTGK
jgi:glycosyltransferase involved in cell wall biosynthesis